MNMNPFISFVIPTYNNAQTICRCIDSIVSLKEKNIEICVVDDGSVDETRDLIVHNYGYDKRIKYTYTENKGAGHARNIGIYASIGRFIAFVDSDDCINTIVYDKAIDYLKCHKCDLICSKYYHVTRKGFFEEKVIYLSEGVVDKTSLYSEYLTGRFNSVWRNIYKSNIIKNNKLIFNEYMKVGEDAVFSIEYSFLCNDIFFFDDYIYYYHENNARSLMHSYNADALLDYVTMFEAYKRIVDENQGLKISFDRKYYLTRSLKHLLNGKKRLSDNQKLRIYKSWFYMEIINFDYSDFISLFKKKMIQNIIKI